MAWEEAGAALWDSLGDEEAAAAFVSCGGVDIVIATARQSLAAHQWRALEISTGMLGNIACHPSTVGQLQMSALAAATVHCTLFAEDAASIGEAVRLASSVLLFHEGQMGVWYDMVAGEDTLSRLAWVAESCQQTTVVERTYVLGAGASLLG
jgi:hypothetical protein